MVSTRSVDDKVLIRIGTWDACEPDLANLDEDGQLKMHIIVVAEVFGNTQPLSPALGEMVPVTDKIIQFRVQSWQISSISIEEELDCEELRSRTRSSVEAGGGKWSKSRSDKRSRNRLILAREAAAVRTLLSRAAPSLTVLGQVRSTYQALRSLKKGLVDLRKSRPSGDMR